MSQDLERRVAQLEYRLGKYHEWLEASLERDRKFQLNATWGIVGPLCGLAAFAGVSAAANNWLHMTGWILGGITTIAAFAAYLAAVAWCNKARDDDEKKLSRLPEWEKI